MDTTERLSNLAVMVEEQVAWIVWNNSPAFYSQLMEEKISVFVPSVQDIADPNSPAGSVRRMSMKLADVLDLIALIDPTMASGLNDAMYKHWSEISDTPKGTFDSNMADAIAASEEVASVEVTPEEEPEEDEEEVDSTAITQPHYVLEQPLPAKDSNA